MGSKRKSYEINLVIAGNRDIYIYFIYFFFFFDNPPFIVIKYHARYDNFYIRMSYFENF